MIISLETVAIQMTNNWEQAILSISLHKRSNNNSQLLDQNSIFDRNQMLTNGTDIRCKNNCLNHRIVSQKIETIERISEEEKT